MGRVENSRSVVAEHAQGRSNARVPVGDVGHTEDGDSLGRHDVPDLQQQRTGIDEMLQYVGGEYNVKTTPCLGEFPAEIGLDERAGAIGDSGNSDTSTP